MEAPSHHGRVIPAVVLAVLFGAAAVLSGGHWAAEGRCDSPLASVLEDTIATSRGRCPSGDTYCAGLILFCCDNGRTLGVCFGAWGCSR